MNKISYTKHIKQKNLETTPLIELVDELSQTETYITELNEYRNKIIMEMWNRIPSLKESEEFQLTEEKQKKLTR